MRSGREAGEDIDARATRSRAAVQIAAGLALLALGGVQLARLLPGAGPAARHAYLAQPRVFIALQAMTLVLGGVLTWRGARRWRGGGTAGRSGPGTNRRE